MIVDLNKLQKEIAEAVGAGKIDRVTRVLVDMKVGEVPVVRVEKLLMNEEQQTLLVSSIKKVPWTDDILVSEYLYAFCAYMTGLRENFIVGDRGNASYLAEHIDKFLKANKLSNPRDTFCQTIKKIVYPKQPPEPTVARVK